MIRICSGATIVQYSYARSMKNVGKFSRSTEELNHVNSLASLT